MPESTLSKLNMYSYGSLFIFQHLSSGGLLLYIMSVLSLPIKYNKIPDHLFS